METQRPAQEEIRIFSDRIARSLSERPLSLEARSHREEVARLLRLHGEITHYGFLEIELVATPLEIHAGYQRVARLVHPSHAERLGLVGREGVLEVLFERATQAYLTLSNPDRRKAYDRELSPEARAGLVAAIAPTAESVHEVARGYYQRALHLAATDDFHFAVQLLQQAVAMEPRGEYLALLGRLQAKNPQWLREAAENLQRAIDMKTPEPGLEAALAEVRLKLHAGTEPAERGGAGPVETPAKRTSRRRR